MSIFKPGTKYGLILPNKGAAAAASKPAASGLAARKKPSIFNQSDSDSDKSGRYLYFISKINILERN